jgi:hypothetical protein
MAKEQLDVFPHHAQAKWPADNPAARMTQELSGCEIDFLNPPDAIKTDIWDWSEFIKDLVALNRSLQLGS